MDSQSRQRSRSPSSRDHKSRKNRSRSPRGDRDEDRHRKHKRRSDRGEDELDDRERRKEKKAKREEKESRKREKREGRDGKGKSAGLQVVDDDESEDEWIEKDMNEVDIQVRPSREKDVDNIILILNIRRMPLPTSLRETLFLSNPILVPFHLVQSFLRP
jgi:hypothetical protein